MDALLALSGGSLVALMTLTLKLRWGIVLLFFVYSFIPRTLCTVMTEIRCLELELIISLEILRSPIRLKNLDFYFFDASSVHVSHAKWHRSSILRCLNIVLFITEVHRGMIWWPLIELML